MLKGRATCDDQINSADLSLLGRATVAGVAQISNLLYGRIAFCNAPGTGETLDVAEACRLEIGDTADGKSALLGPLGHTRQNDKRRGWCVVRCFATVLVEALKPFDRPFIRKRSVASD